MATSAVTNTLTDPSGTALADVVVVARLKPGNSFRTSDNSEVSTIKSTTTNGSGAWSLTLEENANIVPAGTYYEIEEQIPVSAGGAQVWRIQVGASDATLRASLLSTLPTDAISGNITQDTADARYIAIGGLPFTNVMDYGAVGDGVTDDAASIQAAIDATPVGGRIVLPATEGLGADQTVYAVGETLTVGSGKTLEGVGFAGAANGVTIKALAGFTGDAVISLNWSTEDWWHRGVLEGFSIDCDDLVDYGIKVYQMGEESLFRRLAVYRAVDSCYLLAGTHAPATIELCSAWHPGEWGFKFTSHPTLAGNSGGVVRLIAVSGDSTVAGSGHFYFDGSQKVSAVGVKSESWPIGVRWEGSGTGGGAGTGVFSGYFNAVAKTNVIEIQGTATPALILAGLHSSGYTNWINDTVSSRSLPAADIQQLQSLITWNGSEVHSGAQFIMDSQRAISWRRTDTGAVANIFALNSGNQVEWRDHTGTLRLALSGATLGLSEAQNISTGTTTGTKIGTATTQKLGFFNATPVVQPVANADTSGATLGQLETEVNELKATLRSLGLLAT